MANELSPWHKHENEEASEENQTRHCWRSLARVMGVSLQQDGKVPGVDRVIKRMMLSQEKNASMLGEKEKQ